MASRASAVFDPSLPYSPLSVSPSQTALLLLDYQNFILGMIPDEAARATVLQTATSVRDWAKQQGIPIYHCVIDLSNDPSPHAKLNARWSAMKPMIQSNPGSTEIAPPLKPDGSEKVTSRRIGYLSALSSPELAEGLKANDTKSLIVCGISTSAVVLSTVRGANELGYHVTVVEDACFDLGEGVHQTLVEHVLTTSAHVATLEEVVKAWKS